MEAIRKSVIAVTVLGLTVDAYIHMTLAGPYSAVASTLDQGQLFRIEAGAAIVAAILLLLKPGRVTAALAALVAGGGTFALLLCYFVNVGPIGPLPNMYEPIMYDKKLATLIAQSLATAAALALVVIYSRQRRVEATTACPRDESDSTRRQQPRRRPVAHRAPAPR